MENHDIFLIGERTHLVHASANSEDQLGMKNLQAAAVKNSQQWCAANEIYNNQDFYVVRMAVGQLGTIGIKLIPVEPEQNVA